MKNKCKQGYIRKGSKCVKDNGKSEIITSSRNFNLGGGGVGFTGLLTLLFIGLKLGKVINWSWWLVLSPLWISLALGIIMVIIFLIIMRKEW